MLWEQEEQQQCPASGAAAVPEKDPQSLTRLHDDLLGEIYKWCPGRLTKRNLRQACRLTHTSPAINCQVVTARICQPCHVQTDVKDAVQSFPKHATLQRLKISTYYSLVESLRYACDDEACRHKLGSVKALAYLVGVLLCCKGKIVRVSAPSHLSAPDMLIIWSKLLNLCADLHRIMHHWQGHLLGQLLGLCVP